MAWMRRARANRGHWVGWVGGWADNSAASVWELYR